MDITVLGSELHAFVVCRTTCGLARAGKSLAENLADCPELTEEQQVIMPLETPIKPSGHIQILYGNLAPQVCKRIA